LWVFVGHGAGAGEQVAGGSGRSESVMMCQASVSRLCAESW
jgi:hypothetical protein